MTPELADKIMTRIIARVEADGGVLHKSSGIEEIIGTCAVAESEGEIIDVISYDEAKGQWVHRDGTPLNLDADKIAQEEPPPLRVSLIKKIRDMAKRAAGPVDAYVVERQRIEEMFAPLPPLASPTPAEIQELITHGLSVHRIRLEDFKL